MKEKILIIEDDPLIRNELKTLLQSNGYKTVAPEDFSDVIDQIKAEQPHLIILDIKLPGTSGFSLCTEIRTFSEVPIIFVTSCNTDMDELNSIMLGGDAFITKPYNTAILLAKIASLLKKAYPTQQREQVNNEGQQQDSDEDEDHRTEIVGLAPLVVQHLPGFLKENRNHHLY